MVDDGIVLLEFHPVDFHHQCYQLSCSFPAPLRLELSQSQGQCRDRASLVQFDVTRDRNISD